MFKQFVEQEVHIEIVQQEIESISEDIRQLRYLLDKKDINPIMNRPKSKEKISARSNTAFGVMQNNGS